jgi:hypothetical protein
METCTRTWGNQKTEVQEIFFNPQTVCS